MPKGIHSSIRVALAVAPKIHEQLKAWADYEGRPVASLCMYLIENSLRQAQRDGIAPSFAHEETDGIEKVEPRFLGHRFESTAPVEGRKRFTQFYEDRISEKKLEEERKKEKILELLQALTDNS
jgi:hypothetical protein